MENAAPLKFIYPLVAVASYILHEFYLDVQIDNELASSEKQQLQDFYFMIFFTLMV